VYRAPINLRPLYGIQPHVSTKGMGYFAWGYVKMYALTGEASYKERADACFAGCWKINLRLRAVFLGQPFPVCSRSGKTPALEPIVPGAR